MPFLTAKALEIDPDGMAFLRAVIRPDYELEQTAPPRPPRPSMDPQPFEPAAQGKADAPGCGPVRTGSRRTRRLSIAF